MPKESTYSRQNEALQCEAQKFRCLRDRILEDCEKIKRGYRKTKTAVVVVFSFYTVSAALLAHTTGKPMGFLVGWIVMIFLIVFFFVVAEYIRQFLRDTLLPFLRDENVRAFPINDSSEETQVKMEEEK